MLSDCYIICNWYLNPSLVVPLFYNYKEICLSILFLPSPQSVSDGAVCLRKFHYISKANNRSNHNKISVLIPLGFRTIFVPFLIKK